MKNVPVNGGITRIPEAWYGELRAWPVCYTGDTLQWQLFNATNFKVDNAGITIKKEDFQKLQHWYMNEQTALPHTGRYARQFPTVQHMVKTILTTARETEAGFYMADTQALRQLVNAAHDWLISHSSPVITLTDKKEI